jgi:hypothetical protein
MKKIDSTRAWSQNYEYQATNHFSDTPDSSTRTEFMKSTLLRALSNIWRSPKTHLLTLLLILGAWPGASTTHAAPAYAGGAWGCEPICYAAYREGKKD